MNNKIFLFVLLCGGFMIMQAEHIPTHVDTILKKEAKKNTGKCYCSFKCGPRDADEPNDAPFVDPETGICFCQERDRATYFKHGCHKKHNAKIFNSYCAQANEEARLKTYK